MTQPVFDAHLHIVDSAFPLVENEGYLPGQFTVADYRKRTDELHVAGGAVVSGSFQAFDQGYLIAALKKLGPTFVGVTQIPVDTSDRQILELHEAGVRAVRFNVFRGGSASLGELDRLARRAHDLAGWHTELYIDAQKIDNDLARIITALPAVSIDHLGMTAGGLPTLLRLVERGVKVEATGFGRIKMDPATAIRAIMKVDPTALMVGTDLPSTRAERPFRNEDFQLIQQTLEAEGFAPDQVAVVFWGNAADFYLNVPPQ